MDDIKNTVNILERIAQRTFSIYECGALETAISALQELEQYRKIGTLEECREARDLFTEMYKWKMTIAIMERITWVDEDGTILFQKSNQSPEDLAFTITELAKNEEYDFLEVIAERLANREQAAELYKRKYKEAWDELSVERERHKWIPVEERLPEDMEIVLVNNRSGNLYTAYHDCEGWHLAFKGLLFVRDPLAWMPSPKPYNPEPEDTASEPPEWEKRMMNTFLGSRQEKKTERERKNE